LFVPTTIYKLPKFPVWTSPTLKNLILKKKRAYAVFKRSKLPLDYLAFSELRAKCKRTSKVDYQSYIKHTVLPLQRNPSSFWKYTKILTKHSALPSTLRWDDTTVDNPRDSANLLSKYFNSMYNSYITYITMYNYITYITYITLTRQWRII